MASSATKSDPADFFSGHYFNAQSPIALILPVHKPYIEKLKSYSSFTLPGVKNGYDPVTHTRTHTHTHFT